MRTLTRLRSLLAAAALAVLVGAGLVVLPHVVGATPGQPTIAEVTAKLDSLSKQNEALDERYNQATADLKAKQQAADAAQRDALTAAANFDKARTRLRETVTAQYESAAFSSAGALLTSKNGQSYLDTLSTMDLISAHRAQLVNQINGIHQQAVGAQQKASQLLSAAQAQVAALDRQKQQLEASTKTFTNLLAKLTAQQQAEYRRQRAVAAAAAQAAIRQAAAAQAAAAPAPAQPTQSPAPTPPPAQGTSSQVQKAVDFAIAQVGKAYVFAGTGPDAYDCSGLTMQAYAQAGISLPHLAADQYNYGTHVSSSDLQPGDLVFLYSPISHVEIMVGPDLAVSAADEALGVVYVHPSQDMQDFAGATRLV